MKNIIAGLFISFAFTTSFAQESKTAERNINLKWAPIGLFVGNISIQGEYGVGQKGSLTAKIGIPTGANYTLEFDGNDANFELKATTFLAGYRMYLSKRHMKGLYFEPFFKYVHHIGEGLGSGTLGTRNVAMTFTNDYNAFGVGAQLGAQFLIAKRFVIDLFFIGPEINSADNTFRTSEVSNSIPWTLIEAQDAEREVKNFIDQYPFIRNHTKVTVDQNNKTVIADFHGALPGFRTGISFGFTF